MFGRKQARERSHEESRSTAVEYLERVAATERDHEITRAELARAASARQARSAVVAVSI